MRWLLIWNWPNDFESPLQKPVTGLPIYRHREGHDRGEGAVALDQFFEFCHLAAEVSDI
jgi:hypothetical protein